VPVTQRFAQPGDRIGAAEQTEPLGRLTPHLPGRIFRSEVKGLQESRVSNCRRRFDAFDPDLGIEITD
jgi:hypothetical protein